MGNQYPFGSVAFRFYVMASAFTTSFLQPLNLCGQRASLRAQQEDGWMKEAKEAKETKETLRGLVRHFRAL